MHLEKIVEFIFSLVILLLVGVFIILSLLIISIVEELAHFDVPLKWRITITVVLTVNLLYIVKLMVNRFQEYHRYV